MISSFYTVGNYDYGIFWYLYLDGSIEFEAKLTGVLFCRAIADGESPKYGRIVAPNLNAMVHEHYFNVRLDMSVDGDANSVLEVEADLVPTGPDNPHGNAHGVRETLIESESDSARDIKPDLGRCWRVINRAKSNAHGGHPGYRLVRHERQADAPVRLALHEARALRRTRPVGHRLRPRREVRSGRLRQPERGGAGVAGLGAGGPQPGRCGRGALVHDGPAARPAPRGLSGNARRVHRVHAEAERLLRSQSRTRSGAAASLRALTDLRLRPAQEVGFGVRRMTSAPVPLVGSAE